MILIPRVAATSTRILVKIDIAVVRREARRITGPIFSGIAVGFLVLNLTSCGFGQIGPETLILAETPCGRIEYRSSKDQAAPGAVCRVGPDGAGYLEMGADASSGSGAVARAVAEGIVKGIGAAK